MHSDTLPPASGEKSDESGATQLEDVLEIDVGMLEDDDRDIPLEDLMEAQVAKEDVFGRDQKFVEAMEEAQLGADEHDGDCEATQDETAPEGMEDK